MKEAFEKLKVALTSSPVLAFPDFAKPFVVKRDASSVATDAILSHKKDDTKSIPSSLLAER